MEIHHHPHIKEKKFKEYFLEFLMIFLAVTLGFFAESIRENISNNEHAKLLTAQLIKDMKADTLNLQNVIDFESAEQNKVDTLFFLLQKPVEKTDARTIQRLIADCWSIKLFHSSTGAMSAIKNELNIKQFSNSQMPELIADYEAQLGTNKEGEDLLLRLGEQIIEPFFYAHFTPSNIYQLFNSPTPIIDNKMRDIRQSDFDELSVKLEVMKAIIIGEVQQDRKLKDAAVKIIAYVNVQYNHQ